MLLMYFFSLLPIPVLAVTAIVMYRRKQHKLYPVFWAYVIFQFSRCTVEAIAYGVSYAAFFYSYWSSSALSVIFRLLLLRSIFLTVLEGYAPLHRLRRSGYEVAFLVFWALALFLTFHNYGGRRVSQLILDAGQAASFIAVGMFVFVVGSSALLGIRWTSAISGIALGLGLLGTADLAVFAGLSHNHFISTTAAGWIETLTYDCAVGIIAFCFVPRREEIRIPAAIEPARLQWVDSIRGALSE
ncbi:MAG: hypothetical protein DMG61_22630 [Acidobacteria bacterium]|nr:MAG: hypothetical protein DMG61_22630 [Acidobacteriota bacterium]PYY19792.1 MAG: hypothetical protein DMG60_02775 [Acidobacteriota bacterium]